ncbi:MAG: serine hydrolase domain-containing protein [Bacteroidota bacterium]
MNYRPTSFLFGMLIFTPLVFRISAQDRFSQRVDSLLEAKRSYYQIPGLAIGIVQQGALRYAQAYGLKNHSDQSPLYPSSIFHCASVSKLFTAQAIIELATENKLSLDDLLVDFLPHLADRDERIRYISLRQMLNHSAGLPDVRNYHWEDQLRADSSLSQYVEGMTPKLLFPPGTQYRYCNLAYDILGYVVEKASGMLFEDYVKEKILIPAGMIQSDFRYFKIPDSLRVVPHHRKGKQVKVRKIYPYNRIHAPSSTLNASAPELCQWMIYFMKHLQSRKDYQQMLTSSLDFAPGIGLGLQL